MTAPAAALWSPSTSEDVVANPDSYIGQFLADWLGLPAHNGARRDEAPARRRRKVSA